MLAYSIGGCLTSPGIEVSETLAKQLTLSAIAVALSALIFPPSAAIAGPLLDDYLNYPRIGAEAKPGSGDASGQLVGQDIDIPENTAEVFRIGVYALPDPPSWTPDETVTLTLYNSSAKTTRLGTYSIDGLTNKTDGLRYHDKDRLLLFSLRNDPLKAPAYSAPLPRKLYFELSVKGGDGKVTYRTAASDYAAGQLHVDGATPGGDLAFEVDIKPMPDRIANLKKMYALLDLSRPGLSAVKAAVDAGEWDKAEHELAMHFHKRMDIWDAWKDVYQPKIDPNFDTTASDKFIEGYLKSEKGEWIPWRNRGFWAPAYDEKYGKEWYPKGYTWHIERMLSAAYTATANPKYAQAAIRNHMLWMLDNSPNPEITGIEAPHQIWNELAAGGRAPGHGDLPYARMYYYKGWTDDERILWILTFYDNADYMYKSDEERHNGGNWLAQTAENTRNFGMKFPEFRKSPQFTAWGNVALADEALGSVRGDGTNNEAAIKYHAMIARRLKSLLEDEKNGLVTMKPERKAQLTDTLSRMYDHMAYTLQPDNRVVMYGDAWYEDYSAEVAEVSKTLINRPDLLWIATQGKQGKPPAQISKSYPDGGFFIMRSDFGEKGQPFTDARQLFMHNGGWIGGHGHWDLTAINLYAYGRTLLVDPGGMWNPTTGEKPYYWKSNVHSMLVPESWDVTRSPGPTRWISAGGFDYLDSVHYGYDGRGIPEVRRRIVFLKPDYFVVDDTAAAKEVLQWDQTWNILAGQDNVKIDPVSKTVRTTYASGGNLVIYPVVPTTFDIVTRKAEVPMDGTQPTTIEYFRTRTDRPHYTTVLYPYKGALPPLSCEALKADFSGSGATAVKIDNGRSVDYVVFGTKGGGEVSFGGKALTLDGEMLAVRTRGKDVRAYSASNSRRVVSGGRELLRADQPVAMVDVRLDGASATISVREKDPSVVVWVGAATTITINGQKTSRRPFKGYLRLFPDAVRAIVVDDSGAGFHRLTQTTEWETPGDPNGYAMSYTIHETDPGRHEAGSYSAALPKAGRYRLEVYIPKTTRQKSDTMDYTVKGASSWDLPVASAGGAIKDVRLDSARRLATVVVDQQKVDGKWVSLGTYTFPGSQITFLEASNQTQVDGLYPVFDAVRLVPAP